MDFSSITPISSEPFKFGPLQTKWLEALESGEYKQSQYILRDSNNEYCCLGVMCEIAGLPFDDGCYAHSGWKDSQYLPGDFYDKIGLRSSNGQFRDLARHYNTGFSSLTEMNDTLKATFKDIAAYIRHDPHNVFSHAA